MDPAATAFCDLFPKLYLRFCHRHEPGRDRARVTPQQDAVLHHLAMSGPLTVGEMALHFGRAQSVVSEIASGLLAKSLLEKMADARDRRRTLVWLSDEGREVLERRSQVLDPRRVEGAMKALSPEVREALVAALSSLVEAADADTRKTQSPHHEPHTTTTTTKRRKR
jgi:DNA-binding MarR family transcriptional regulator